MDNGQNGFDLDAAWLRRANGDMRAFTEALAVRLEAALPGAVQLDRRRDGLFSGTTHVTRITVRIEGGVLTLDLDHGRFSAKRVKVVRGVKIGSTELTVAAWLEEVLDQTRSLGERAGTAREALHDFLMS